MEAYSVVNLCPTTKEQALAFSDKLVGEVESGNISALDLHIKLIAMEKSIADVKKRIAEYALSESEKYGSKSFEHLHAKVDVVEVGVKYDYSSCGDAEWHEIDDQINSLSEKKKDREKFLKTLTKPLQLVKDDGEGIIVNPPLKTSTTGLKISLI